jgi:hypothetical protein
MRRGLTTAIRTLLLASLAVTAAPVVGAQQAAVPGVALELSDDAEDALTETFPDWRPASIDAAAACVENGPGVARVDADFDGDGTPDMAVLVATGEGVRLVVLLARQDRVALHDVDQVGTTAATGSLTVAPRGSVFVSPLTGITDYYSNATVTVVSCGTTTAFTWAGLGFRKICAR